MTVRPRFFAYFLQLLFSVVLLFILFFDKTLFHVADNNFFIPHLKSVNIYLLKNGLFHLPYWVPSFNGGVPQYADPQDLTFSLIQLCVNCVPNVYRALLCAFILQLILLYIGTRLLFRTFHIAPVVASFGAFAFSINGFNVVRWFVGHLTFHTYWVIPWVLYFLLQFLHSGRGKAVSMLGSIGMLLALAIFSSGVVPLFQIGVLAVVFILVDRLLGSSKRSNVAIFGGLSAALALAILLTVTKIYPTMNYLRVFPRVLGKDIFPFRDNLLLIFNGLFNPLIATDAKVTFGGWLEFCCYIGFSSVMFLPILFLAFRHYRKVFAPPIILANRFFLFGTIFSVAACLFFMSGGLLTWPYIANLPVVSANHAVYRIMGILPLMVAGLMVSLANGLYRIDTRWRIIVCAMLSLWLFDICFHQVINRPFRNESSNYFFNGDLNDVEIQKWEMSNSLGGVQFPNPMYGFHGELFDPQIDTTLPPLARFSDETFNVVDPVSLVFPSFTGRKPWSRLPTSTGEDKVKDFLAFRDPEFPMPRTQHVANAISLVSWILTLFFVIRGFMLAKSDGNRIATS